MQGNLGAAFKEMTLKDEDFSRVSPLEKAFKATKKVNDPRFGEVQVMADAAGKTIVARERKFTDKAEAGRAINAARAKIANQNPYSLRLLDYSTTKQSELCSTVYSLKQFWESPGNDLRKEIGARQANHNYFSESEISNVLYSVAKADAQGTHGDICPQNIIYDKVTGGAKLVDKSEDLPNPGRNIGIQKNKMLSNQPLYISNNMYNNLKNSKTKFNIDPSKEDAFSLGLSLLEMGNLRSVQNIYNSSAKEVDRAALAKHLDEFKARYPNSFLNNTVDGLVRYDDANRLGIKELSGGLPRGFETKSSAVTSSANGATTTVTTTTNTTTEVIKPLENVQKVETSVNVTPVPSAIIPSIYSTDLGVNPFYVPPAIPALSAFTEVKAVEPKYTPIEVEMQLKEEVDTKIIQNPVPATTTETKTVTTTKVDTVVADTNSISTPTTVSYTAYAPVSTTYSGQITPAYSGSITPSYTSGTSNRIVLEPEIRRTYIDIHGNVVSGFNEGVTSYSPAVYTSGTSYIPAETVTSASPVITTGTSYTTYAPSYASGTSYTYSTPSPLITTETTHTTAAPTITTYSPTFTTGTTYTTSSPVYTTSGTTISTSPVTVPQTYISGETYVSAAPTSTITTIVADGTNVSGLKLVRSYQDPKFATG